MRTESTQNIINFEQVKPTEPIAPYLGGKQLLAKTIVPIIEQIPHNIYCEPFMGMGGVFFRRTQKPKCEAINDINSEIINMFRMVERFPDYLADMLKFKICSRAEFKRMLATPPLLLTELELRELLDKKLDQISPKDEKETYLIHILKEFRPDELYDGQMKELLLWGKGEQYLWSVNIPQ